MQNNTGHSLHPEPSKSCNNVEQNTRASRGAIPALAGNVGSEPGMASESKRRRNGLAIPALLKVTKPSRPCSRRTSVCEPRGVPREHGAALAANGNLVTGAADAHDGAGRAEDAGQHLFLAVSTVICTHAGVVDEYEVVFLGQDVTPVPSLRKGELPGLLVFEACERCLEKVRGEPQVVLGGGDKAFTFDQVYDSGTPQEVVYQALLEVAQTLQQGLVGSCTSACCATHRAQGGSPRLLCAPPPSDTYAPQAPLAGYVPRPKDPSGPHPTAAVYTFLRCRASRAMGL